MISYGAMEFLTYLVEEALWNDWEWPPKCTAEKPTDVGEEEKELQTNDKTSEETQCGIQTNGEIAETKPELCKVFLTFPLSHGLLVSKLISEVKLQDVAVPVIRRYLLEKEFFLYHNLSNLQWKVKAVRDSDDEYETNLSFSGIMPALSQETFHVTTMKLNQLYFLKLKHEVIDVLFVTNDSEHTRYLVFLQISLNKYSQHKSKFGNIYKQKKFDQEKTSMLDYYCSKSGIDKGQTLYLYVSPNQLVKDDDDLWNIFDIKPACTTRPKPTQGKVAPKILVGALIEHCDVADFILAISKTKDKL